MTGVQTCALPISTAPPPAGSGAALSTDRGGGIGVWLLPVLLVAGTAVMIYRVARRPTTAVAGPAQRTGTTKKPAKNPAKKPATTRK